MLRIITLTSIVAMLSGCGDIAVTGGKCLVGATVACECGSLPGTQICNPPGELADCVCDGDATGTDADASDTGDVAVDVATDLEPTDTLGDPGPGDITPDSQPLDVAPDLPLDVPLDVAPDVPPCDPPGQQMCAGTCATCPTGSGVLQTGCDGTACVALECTEGHYLCAGDCCAWTIEVPDQSSPLGERMKLSLTPDDKLVFAYHYGIVSPPADGVRVLIQSGISWTPSDVTMGGQHFLGLDVGSNGTIVVSTDTGSPFGATIFSSDGSGWAERFWPDATVNPITIVAAHPAVGSTGQPHVLLRDEGVGTGWLKHAYIATKAADWETTTLANNVSLAVLSNNESIALDSGDQPHVAYHDGLASELKHQFRVGATWETRTVAVGETISPSIAVMNNDTPRIAYVHEPSGMLRYATFDGAWNSEDVVAVSCKSLALALGPNGKPFIAYLNDAEGGRLELARRGPDGWVISVVDDETTIGAIDIVVKANGEPAIGYEDAALHRIKLATP